MKKYRPTTETGRVSARPPRPQYYGRLQNIPIHSGIDRSELRSFLKVDYATLELMIYANDRRRKDNE